MAARRHTLWAKTSCLYSSAVGSLSPSIRERLRHLVADHTGSLQTSRCRLGTGPRLPHAGAFAERGSPRTDYRTPRPFLLILKYLRRFRCTGDLPWATPHLLHGLRFVMGDFVLNELSCLRAPLLSVQHQRIFALASSGRFSQGRNARWFGHA